MAHATTAELQDFVGAAVTLPADAEKLLRDASALVDRVTLLRYDTTSARHLEALKNATCAQVEYVLEVGEVDKTAPRGREQIGNFSREAPGRLSPRAYDFLLVAGLLYRGVNTRG